MPTALEIAQGRQTRLTAGLLMSVLTDTPLFSAFDVRTTPETRFLTLSLDALPTSEFVKLGQGFKNSTAALSIREASCAMIGGLVSSEVASENLWNAAHATAGYTWFGLQTDSRVKADLLNIETQIIYGLANDANGFPGAKDMTPFVSGNTFTMSQTPQAYKYKRSVLNVGSAGGLTANTASSIYSFCFGPLDTQLVLGNDVASGELFQFSNIIRQYITDPNDSSRQLLVNQASLAGHVGLAVGGFSPSQVGQSVPTQYALRRAANITADAGATATDAVMEKLFRSHGPAKRPNLFAMSYRSGEQIAKSRTPTAINFLMGVSGSALDGSFATTPPPPDNYKGVPIVYPLCIGDTDAVEV